MSHLPTLPLAYCHIPDFDGYRVSNHGVVQSDWVNGPGGWSHGQWHDLHPTDNRYGYFYVDLWRDGERHRRFIANLVLECFKGSRPEPEYEACHAPDPDKSNNREDNLYWGTHQQNVDDMVAQGTRLQGSRLYNAKLTEQDVVEIRRLHEQEGVSCRRLAKVYQVDRTNIQKIVNNEAWTHVTLTARGRLANGELVKGSKNHSAKLTEQDAAEIRRLHEQEGLNYKQIAKLYPIGRHAISNIARRKTWRHV